MSTANGGSLDDCITNLFALTELVGLQWRQYECPPWNGDSNPKTLLHSEPIFVAYSKLQADGILSVWRRLPKGVPKVYEMLPTLQGAAPKELWVFWYGTSEPVEIEKHCKELIKKKSEEEQEDGLMTSIPYDVRCLLYKAWNTQMEKHYRTRKFLQVGRWFIRPHKFLDPSSAFAIDDFALAHSHSFNIVGGNSMCMAIKTQLQPNLVQLSPFHIERNRKYRETKINVILAPWSLNAHISLRYSLIAQTKKEEEEVDRQLSLWKLMSMFGDGKKKKKRRRDEGGETEGDESEDEGWGEKKMPKMIRVEVDGNIRMWWPTQYVLVTLEETRRLVRERYPVADLIKTAPQKESRMMRNRFAHLTSSEVSLRLSQAVIDDGNFYKIKPLPLMAPPEDGLRVMYRRRRRIQDVKRRRKIGTNMKIRRRKKMVKLSFEERTYRIMAKEEALNAPRQRVYSVESDDEMDEEEMKKAERRKKLRQFKKMMKSRRYNWRAKNGKKLTKKETDMKSLGFISSGGEDDDKRDHVESSAKAWRRRVGESRRKRRKEEGKITKDLNMLPDNCRFHVNRASTVRRKKSSGNAYEERLARSPFTPVRVVSPTDKALEADQMKKDIIADMIAANEPVIGAELSPEEFVRHHGAYFNYHAARTSPSIHYKSYHSRRQGSNFRTPVPTKPITKSTHDDLAYCSSDEDGAGRHICRRRRDASPDPVKAPRPPHIVPNFETDLVGGINVPPVLELNPDVVMKPKPSASVPSRNNPIEWSLPSRDSDEGDDALDMDELRDLQCNPVDLGSDEEELSDDRYSTGSIDLLQPLSATGVDDAGEGTSSGAENWRDYEDMETDDGYIQHNMDSSSEMMDTDCMPLHSDSVLSPPASNERADSHNSMYHRLPGGPHSVGDTVLNKIYPTPPSLLQVDMCSPAMMGGPHSQARKEEREDGSSSHDDDDEMIVKYLDEFELKDDDVARGANPISHLHSQLSTRQFFDNAPKSDVPLSSRFGSLHRRTRVPDKRTVPIYNKKDGEKKETIADRHAEVLTKIENFTNCKTFKPSASSSAKTAAAPGGQPPPLQPHQPPLYPSLAAHQHYQQQLAHHHQSQPGPSSMAPSHLHPSQMTPQHQAYMAGAVPPGQMGGVYGGQAGGTAMRQHPYLPNYGAAVQQQQAMQQQPGFPQQQQQPQPQPPQYMGAGGQMMMGGGQPGQPGYHPAGMQMRPPGYPPGYPAGSVAGGGVHPMQTAQGMQAQHMAAYQNQMMYRQGMGAQGSYPPSYVSPMGGMMAPPNTMAGMQMGTAAGGGQYAGQMQQPGMMMQQPQHGQPMIAGAPHPMGMNPAMVGHPAYASMAAAAPTAQPVVPPPAPSSASIIFAGVTKRAPGAAILKKNRAVIACPIDEERALIATRRGEDPYVNSLRIAPPRLFNKGNKQLQNEFDLYTTERILEKERKRGNRPFGAPIGGSEGLSIVAAVMLQDTILNLHFDWVFDSCPICACTTSIRSRDLGVYIKPPEVLEEPLDVQEKWVGPWNGFHSESPDAQCTCGFSVIRHRQLSMRAGLFLEDSKEATGDDNSGTAGASRFASIWFDPSSAADHALLETLRTIAMTTDLGRFVAAIKNISQLGSGKGKKKRRRRRNEKVATLGSIGTPRVEYVVSQMDKMELVLMGNSALKTAHTSGNTPSPSVGDSPYFHPWGLQIASDVADPTEMEIKNLLEDVKPLIEGAVREARQLSSASMTPVVEGPLTWRSLAAKNVKSSGNGDDDSHIAEPIPLIEMSTEKDAIRIAPTVMKNWEQFNLGPIDVPKDVLYLAVTPDDDRVYDMTVVYMRRMGKMYEQNLRLGRHVAYLTKDQPNRTPVREGIVRASTRNSHYAPYGITQSDQSDSMVFVRTVEKYAESVGCSKEFIRKLGSYVMCMEEVLFEHLQGSRIFERDGFRECVTYALYNRRLHRAQKTSQNASKHDRDTEEGSPPAGDEEARRGEEEERRKESQKFSGALAEAMGMGPGSANSKVKKAKRPFGQSPPYGMEAEKVFKPIDWPDEEPSALPQTVVIYLTLWPCWGSQGRDGEAARVATIAIVRAFNSVIKKLQPTHRGLCLLELIPIQRLEEVVGNGADLDRLDRSSNLNTWQIGNMNRNGEVYPTDRPRIEDILKDLAIGIYRKPRFLHTDSLKNCLPKSMTKFGPASATLEWIEKKDGKRKTIYRCQSVPFQLANTPAIVAKTEAKYSQLCMDEVSLYISYCLVGTDFIVVTVTDNLGARADSAVLNLKPKNSENRVEFRSRNKTTVRDGLDKLWKFIEGLMLNESKPIRLVIGKLGKLGHGEFKAWCHVLSRSNLKKFSTRLREGCPPCNANAGAPALLSACLVSTEPEAHLQVLPSYSLPSDISTGGPKKIRPMHTPGDNTITHIMVFPISSAIQLAQSTEMGVMDDDGDDFGDLDVQIGGIGDDMNEIMNELMTGDGEGEGRAAARNQHMNSFFDGALESGVQNQPLAAGWMISTAPGGDLPDWFWSSCPSLKRRLPVHLRSSLHINEAQLMRSDDIMKKTEKEQEFSHALDSQKTDEVLRHVLEEYNDLSWLALDSITQERRSCLPIHIQALTRLHDTVLNLIM